MKLTEKLNRRLATWLPVLATLCTLALFPPALAHAQQWQQSSSNANDIHNTNNGNVGIGTTAPEYRLDVNGTLRARSAFSSYTADGLFGASALPSRIAMPGFQSALLFGYADMGLGDYSPRIGFMQTYDATQAPALTAARASIGLVRNGSLVFMGGANNTEHMRVAHNGNVGIGTTSPGSLLQVGSGNIAGYVLPGINVALTGASYMTASDGTRTTFMGADGSGTGMIGTFTNHNLALRTNNTARVTIDTSGRVGIGTTNPTARLQVEGTAAINGNTTVNGDMTVSGNISARYQDLAEWVTAREGTLPAGTVVILDPTATNQVMASARSYDTSVAGVVSAQPGIILGEAGAGRVMVATTGRIRVRVDATRAPIRVGDLLVTSEREGYAMRSEPLLIGGRPFHSPGTLIGKALEPLERGVGEILVLLSLQ